MLTKATDGTLDPKLGNCEEELPKKPVGRQSADRRPTGFA